MIGQTAEGETINVLVIDSEGLGALDENSTHDSRVFSLVILLSSCFVYNSVGSIDENAVQNLSLVVNLTKNIQIKSQGLSEEIDSEDYAKYFPTFVWVVRDFTLQLIDQEGESISPKEYLERSLAAQKGFSESVEQKNRIRRLLTTFFKERDCFTLVRPLTDEENLQNLDKIDFDQLRPEFVEQVIQLRRRVLNRIRPKVLNGKSLNGEMFSGLVRAYVTAINNGAVPNIESAWTYICRQECTKAAAEGVDTYETIIRELLQNKLPLPAEDIKQYHKMARDAGVQAFNRKAVGQIAEDIYSDFLKKLKSKYVILKLENEKESTKTCNLFISGEFAPLERRLKMNEYRSFRDFELDVRQFQTYFLDKGPKGPNRKQIICEFVAKILAEAAVLFIKGNESEIDLQKTLLNETSARMNHQMEELRNEFTKEKTSWMTKLSSLEATRAEVEMREQTMKENYAEMMNEKNKLEKELKDQMTTEKKALQRQIEELKTKVNSAEDGLKEIERVKILNASEYEKEKALLLQKVLFYEKSMEDMESRHKESSSDLKTVKKEHANTIKELTSKNEAQIRSLNQKIAELQERVSEFESDLIGREQKYDSERKKWESAELNFTSLMEEANQTIINLQGSLKEALAKNEEEGQRNDYERMVAELTEKANSLEIVARQKDEGLKNVKNAAERDKAILQQKIEFLELQLNETRQQLNETKKAQESILNAFEATAAEKEAMKSDSRQLQELKDSHRREMKQLEGEFEQRQKRLTEQIESLTKKNHELELKAKFDVNDYAKEINSLKEQVEQAEQMKGKLSEQNKALDSQKIRIMKETEERFASKIRSLEQQLEEAQSKSIREIRDLQAKSEETLSHLRNVYECEKEKLERRIIEEKEKSDKRYTNLQEEYETRLKEEQNLHEEEMESLRDDLRETETNQTAIINQLEHELALKTQQIETLEKYAKETKESLQALQSNNSATMEQQMAMFTAERKTLLAKIESLTGELNKRERELFALGQKKENLEGAIGKKEEAYEQAKKEFSEEKTQLLEKMEELKGKLTVVNDEYLNSKIELGKDLALSNQQIEFMKKKIEEQQKSLDDVVGRYEDKLKVQKSELLADWNEKLEKLTEEKTALEAKYEKNRKSLKEVDNNYTKQISTLEREKAILQEKLSNLETKKAELEAKVSSEGQNASVQLSHLKEASVAEKRSLQNELDKWKMEYGHLDNDFTELSANYERDRALWEGKFHFLEQQRDQAKSDLADAQKKFELTLQHIQKHRTNDKEESESSHNAVISSIEKRYQTQIQDLTDGHQKNISELEEKVRRLEREVKTHQDRYMLENHGKVGNQMILEKKLAELMESEKRWMGELEEVKAERDAKIAEYQKMLDGERDNLKNKLGEWETKFKESEAKRGALIFEHEKERAKWSTERDNISNQRNEVQEALERSERKREMLLRENEKLKSESRANRRSVNIPNHGLASNVVLTLTKNNLNSKRQQSPLSTNSNSSNRDIFGQKGLNDITNKTGENFRHGATSGMKFVSGGDEDLLEAYRMLDQPPRNHDQPRQITSQPPQ